MKQRHDFFQWPQVKLAVGISHPMRAVECGPVADGDHHIVQPMPLARVIMHVSRRHDGKSHVMRYIDQGSCQSQIASDPITLNLDKKMIASKDRFTVLCKFSSCAETLSFERARQESVAACTGQNDQPIVPRTLETEGLSAARKL